MTRYQVLDECLIGKPKVHVKIGDMLIVTDDRKSIHLSRTGQRIKLRRGELSHLLKNGTLVEMARLTKEKE